LQFLSSTKAPFWINAYTYFAYKDDPSGISLDYALFNPNAGMVDPYTKLCYDNMLYAQVDATIIAITRMGYGNIEVKVSKTGWSSKGDPNEVGATLENAAMYNRVLLRRHLGSEGTPLRPSVGPLGLGRGLANVGFITCTYIGPDHGMGRHAMEEAGYIGTVKNHVAWF
ncbi:Glyco_hydro_17 domain-containing protein, partial [Cephalotus follicularis]